MKSLVLLVVLRVSDQGHDGERGCRNDMSKRKVEIEEERPFYTEERTAWTELRHALKSRGGR